MRQLICGNGIAKIEGGKIVAIDLPKIGGERESCLNKKNIFFEFLF